MAFSPISSVVRVSALALSLAVLAPTGAHADAAITTIASSSEAHWDRVAVTSDGNIFVSSPRTATAASTLSLIKNGQPTPFASDAPGFTNIAGLSVADGSLWVLDAGASKVLKIDPASGHIVRSIPLGAQPKDAVLSGLAVHGNFAYIADAGRSAIVLLNLTTGEVLRCLEGSPGLVARHPVVVNGKTRLTASGAVDMTNVSMLTVSPDGQWLYLQPPGGMLYRLATTLITDPLVTPIEQQEGLTLWQMTGALGGLTVDAQGTLYFSDLPHHAIDTFTVGRIPATLSADPRLNWPGNPAIGPDGTVYVPVVQQSNTAPATDSGGTASLLAVHIGQH